MGFVSDLIFSKDWWLWLLKRVICQLFDDAYHSSDWYNNYLFGVT